MVAQLINLGISLLTDRLGTGIGESEVGSAQILGVLVVMILVFGLIDHPFAGPAAAGFS